MKNLDMLPSEFIRSIWERNFCLSKPIVTKDDAAKIIEIRDSEFQHFYDECIVEYKNFISPTHYLPALGSDTGLNGVAFTDSLGLDVKKVKLSQPVRATSQ